MTPELLQQAIARGSEQRSIEFKAAGPRTDRVLLSKVLKAVLAMANVRDGGAVVLGVAERDGGLEPTGVTTADAATWTLDPLADSVAEYAAPNVEFEVSRCSLEDKTFIVIKVQEFTDTPVLCKKSFSVEGKVVLSEGACYVRPRHKPESAAVSTYADMRDLLELAAEKALRRFLRIAHAAGAQVGVPAGSDELFRNQLGELE